MITRQEGQVQVEQSDIRLALNMGNITIGAFLRTTIEETQHLIKKPCAVVREEQKSCVEFPGHTMVKSAMDRHPAMILHNHTDG